MPNDALVPVLWQRHLEFLGQLRRLSPIAVIQRNALGHPLRRRLTFWVAGKQNFTDTFHARAVADEFHQIQHFAREMLSATNVARVDDDFEDAVTDLIDRFFADAHTAGE